MAEAAEKMEMAEREILAPSRGAIQFQEHAYRNHSLTVANNVDPKEDLENPRLWVNVASQLRLTDEVRVMNMDQTWVARVIITFVHGPDVRARLLDVYDLEGEMPDQDDLSAFEVKLCGPLKWCVVRKEDGSRIKENIATKLQAQKELDDYERALRA